MILKFFCLDNSKDKFKEYFDKFEFENLEFINFKDGTKWNNYLEHLEKDELTDLERKNMYVSDPELYAFDTSVRIIRNYRSAFRKSKQFLKNF